MRIDSALHALRSNPASQRVAQTALECAKAAWRDDDEHSAIFEGLIHYGMGDDLTRHPALLGLFAEAEKSVALVDRLVGRLLPELAAHPLGQIAFRHQYSGGMAIIQLVAKRRYLWCCTNAAPQQTVPRLCVSPMASGTR